MICAKGVRTAVSEDAALRASFRTGWKRNVPLELRFDGETVFRGTFSQNTISFTVPLDAWAGKTVCAELLFWPGQGVPVCLMSPIELITTGRLPTPH